MRSIFLCMSLFFMAVCVAGCTPKVRKMDSEVVDVEKEVVAAPGLKMIFHKKEMLAGPRHKEQFCYFEVRDEGNAEVYKLVRHTINDKMECLGSFVRNEMNLLCWLERPEEMYMVNFYGFYPGEPIDYYLVSVNDQRVAKAHIIPNPMQVIKKNGYHLSAEIATPDGLTFIFHASGFDSYEVVRGIAATDRQQEGFNLAADEEGKLVFTINPAWTDEPGGGAEIELQGDKGQIRMNYPWGIAYVNWAESVLYDSHNETR